MKEGREEECGLAGSFRGDCGPVFNWQANARLDDHQARTSGDDHGAERARHHMALAASHHCRPRPFLSLPTIPEAIPSASVVPLLSLMAGWRGAAAP